MVSGELSDSSAGKLGLRGNGPGCKSTRFSSHTSRIDGY